MNLKQSTRKLPPPPKINLPRFSKIGMVPLTSRTRTVVQTAQLQPAQALPSKDRPELTKKIAFAPIERVAKFSCRPTEAKPLHTEHSDPADDSHRQSLLKHPKRSAQSSQLHGDFAVGQVRISFPNLRCSQNVYSSYAVQASRTSHCPPDGPPLSVAESQALPCRKLSIESKVTHKALISIMRSASSSKHLTARVTCDSATELAKPTPFGKRISTLLNSNSTFLDSGNQAEQQAEEAALEQPSDDDPLSRTQQSVAEHLRMTQNRYGRFNLADQGQPLFGNSDVSPLVPLMTEIATTTALKERALFLAIDLFFFGSRLKSLRNFELKVIALTAVSMASKFEDAWSFLVNPFFGLDCVRSSKHTMNAVERMLLEALDFNVNVVLVYDFFQLFGEALRLPPEALRSGLFFLNAALCFEDFQQSDKGLVALALCRFAARKAGFQLCLAEVGLTTRRYLCVKGSKEKGRKRSHCQWEDSGKELLFEKERVEEAEAIFEKVADRLLRKAGASISERYNHKVPTES